MKPPKRHPVVRVEWIDAQDFGGSWHDLESVQQWAQVECLIVSYGLLLLKTKRYLVLAADVGNDADLSRVTKIPRGWVRSIRRVKG